MFSQRVLITGANGYISQHVVATFLEAGHSVRGIVRSEAKVNQLQRIFREYAGTSQLDFGIVPDIAEPGAFDLVLVSDPPFDVVLHTASPFNIRKNTSPSEFMDPAIRGTTEILRGISRVAPTVKRVVVTSSFGAVMNLGLPRVTHPAKVYTEADWNPVTLEQASAETAPAIVAYLASKKFAEQAAWEFVSSTNQPSFDIVALDPPSVFGPLYDPSEIASVLDLSESVFEVYQKTLKPGLTDSSPLPPMGIHLYVDVRDLATAHLLAATVPAAGGHRFVICAEQGHMSMQRIVNIFRETLPELRSRIPRGEPEQWPLAEGTLSASSNLAKEVLGLKFRTPEATMTDMAVQLAEIDERLGHE